jgi:TrmH family RNA methyltransferase
MQAESRPLSLPLKPLKYYRRLATRKGRLEAGAVIVEGERAIRQVVEASPGSIVEMVSVSGMQARFPQYPRRTLTRAQFRTIATTKTPSGVLAVVGMPQDTYATHFPERPGDRLLLLEDVQDPGNVGTLVRTAAAFGFSGVILSGRCADPFSPKAVQATAGSVLSVWLRRTDGYLVMVEELRRRGYFLLAADLGGSEEETVTRGDGRLLLALGSEASGLSPQVLALSHARLRLPIVRHKAESLNVAVSGAILMYLASRA